MPNATLTAATPAATPDSTGIRPSKSVGTERYTASNSTTISTMLAADSQRTSRMIVSRVSTANTPGPVIDSRYDGATAANALRIAAIADACASVSEPALAVCASSTARWPSRDTHTPSRIEGCAPLSS